MDRSLNPHHPTKHYDHGQAADNYQYDGRLELNNMTVDDDNLPVRDNNNLVKTAYRHELETRKEEAGLTQVHRYHHPEANINFYPDDTQVNNNPSQNNQNNQNNPNNDRTHNHTNITHTISHNNNHHINRNQQHTHPAAFEIPHIGRYPSGESSGSLPHSLSSGGLVNSSSNNNMGSSNAMCRESRAAQRQLEMENNQIVDKNTTTVSAINPTGRRSSVSFALGFDPDDQTKNRLQRRTQHE
jgi:hypothetical protein